MPLIDMHGIVFGTLTVLTRAASQKGVTKWVCRCLCGVERSYSASNLKNNVARCTCSGGHTFHGLTKTSIYKTWQAMKARCFDEKSRLYHRYGGRGISVHPEWRHEFLTFKNWAESNGWSDGLELDRINNNGNYEPSNCRFVTSKQNCRNKSNNKPITFNGETLLQIEWAERLGVSKGLLNDRLSKLGWSVEKALTTPKMSFSEAAKCKTERVTP